MSDVFSPETFVDGGAPVTAARLNNHVNGAAIQGTFITGKTQTAPTSDDFFVFYENGAAGLRKCSLTQLLAAGSITSITLAVPSALLGVSGSPLTASGTITLSLVNQNANTMLLGPASGSAASPGFRLPLPLDLTVPTGTISALDVDWSITNIWKPKTISANSTFTFSNLIEGGWVLVPVKQDATGGRTVTWPTCNWPGTGTTQPTAATTANSTNFWAFVYTNGTLYGTVPVNYT